MYILLAIILSCSQLHSIQNRLQSTIGTDYQQKMEIMNELEKVVPFCPVITKNDDGRTKTRN